MALLSFATVLRLLESLEGITGLTEVRTLHGQGSSARIHAETRARTANMALAKIDGPIQQMVLSWRGFPVVGQLDGSYNTGT